MAVRYSKISTYKIKKIIRCFCADIDASKTSIILDLNRNTINRYFKIFREKIYKHQIQDFKKFFGTVEVDESYFGPSRLRGKQGPHRRGRGTWKQPVFGVFERDGRVYTEIIPDVAKATLRKVIIGKISLESIVVSDGWRGYNGLVDVGYDKHLRIDKSKSFSFGNGVHINGIESFWSFTKRRLSKFNGVKRYFDLHLKECEWRWKKGQKQLENELWKMLLK
jgi:transposase